MWLTVGMFTEHAVQLDMGYPIARARFLELAHGDWLDGPSRDAYADGLVGEARVGPLCSVPGMSKLARVSPLHRVAAATIGSLLHRIAATLAGPAAE